VHLVGPHYANSEYMSVLGLIAINGTGVKNIDFDNGSGCKQI
jgi:hypothetical protein